MRRLQEKVNIFNEMKDSIQKKLQDSKDVKVKQTETYQNIIKTLLTTIKGYQKYIDAVERNFVLSYENLLLMVDHKFDPIKDAKKDLTKIDLDSKEKKLLNTQSLSLIDLINEYVSPVQYEELGKIFEKTVKDLRGRKFLDDKEASALFGNVLGGGAPASTPQPAPAVQEPLSRLK